jgi:hypothetical protein
VDPRKPLAWLMTSWGWPVGVEALRLRTNAESWEKRPGLTSKGGAKVAKPKLGKSEAAKQHKPKQTPINPYKCLIPHAGEAEVPSIAGRV